MWKSLRKQKPVRMFAAKYVLSSPCLPLLLAPGRRLLTLSFQPGQCDASKDKDKTIPATTTIQLWRLSHCCQHSPKKHHRIPDQDTSQSFLRCPVMFFLNTTVCKGLAQSKVSGRNEKTGEFLKKKINLRSSATFYLPNRRSFSAWYIS